MPAGFYTPTAPDRFASTSAPVGPWAPRLSHGSPPAALLVRAIEHARPRPDARVGRVSLDFHSPVPVAEVTVTTEMVRPGSRIELARARLSAGGKTAMEASAWRIATQPSRVTAVADVRRPPALPPPQPPTVFPGLAQLGYGDAL